MNPRQILGLAGLLLWSATAQAGTIPVVGGCTLPNAILAANTDTAVGGCAAGSGADRIILRQGSLHVLDTVDNTEDGPTALPVITSQILLAGNDSVVRRPDEAPPMRLVHVASSGHLTVWRTTFQGGLASAPGFGGLGGGVFNRGTVTLRQSIVAGNNAVVGGGVDNLGVLTMHASTLAGNTASRGGGGLRNAGRAFVGPDSVVTGNTAEGDLGGGGIFNQGDLAMREVLISGNTASVLGGGLHNFGTLRIWESTMAQNSTAGNGGALYQAGRAKATLTESIVTGNTAGGHGGGLWSLTAESPLGGRSGLLTLVDSALTENTAAGNGGGLWMAHTDAGTAAPVPTLTRVTLAGNMAANGGGMEQAGPGIVLDSFVLDNHASGQGGGVRHAAGELQLTATVITSNSAVVEGGGLAVLGGAVVRDQTVILGNTAPVAPEVLDLAPPPAPM